VQLFGSGPILREALRAQQMLAEKYQVSSNVWSVTSYTELRRVAHAAARWNMLHPAEKPRRSYLEELLGNEEGPFVASSDYVRAVAEQISPWVPGGLFVLGTDGLGRSDTRQRLRRHFEVDAECITLAALTKLAEQGKFDRAKLAEVVANLGVAPDKVDPLFA
jgi:pyruvate dehydrogenase E1 component